jgi:DNA-binding NarL/FixJ family response regulator
MPAALVEPALGSAPRPRLRLVGRMEERQLTRELRVVIADARALVRAALRALLEREAGIEVVAEAATADEAVWTVRRTGSDVALLDASLADGLGATEAIARRSQARVILLTGRGDGHACVVAALRAGASGFLAGAIEPAELVRAIRAVARGEAMLSPSATRRLLQDLAPPVMPLPTPDGLEELTRREREAMALAARGLSNEEIGERLQVSPATARTHLYRAMAKLQARNRAQLVAFAYESGLVAGPA